MDRAALGVTSIGSGTKLDNMVHIGHNCRIGRHVIIVAQTGLSGGVIVDDYAVIGGQVGIGDKAHIESKAVHRIRGWHSDFEDRALGPGGVGYAGAAVEGVSATTRGAGETARDAEGVAGDEAAARGREGRRLDAPASGDATAVLGHRLGNGDGEELGTSWCSEWMASAQGPSTGTHTPNMRKLMDRGVWTLRARAVHADRQQPELGGDDHGRRAPNFTGITSNDWQPDKFEIAPFCHDGSNHPPTIFGLIQKARPGVSAGLFTDWVDFVRLVEPIPAVRVLRRTAMRRR